MLKSREIREENQILIIGLSALRLQQIGSASGGPLSQAATLFDRGVAANNRTIDAMGADAQAGARALGILVTPGMSGSDAGAAIRHQADATISAAARNGVTLNRDSLIDAYRTRVGLADVEAQRNSAVDLVSGNVETSPVWGFISDIPILGSIVNWIRNLFSSGDTPATIAQHAIDGAASLPQQPAATQPAAAQPNVTADPVAGTRTDASVAQPAVSQPAAPATSVTVSQTQQQQQAQAGRPSDSGSRHHGSSGDDSTPRPAVAARTGANPGGSTGANPGGSTGANPGGSTGANPGGSTGANSGGSTGANPGGSTGANPGGSTGANPGGSTGANPGGSTGANPGGSTGANPGGSTGANPGGSTGANPGGSTGANPGGSTGATPPPADNTHPLFIENTTYNNRTSSAADYNRDGTADIYFNRDNANVLVDRQGNVTGLDLNGNRISDTGGRVTQMDDHHWGWDGNSDGTRDAIITRGGSNNNTYNVNFEGQTSHDNFNVDKVEDSSLPSPSNGASREDAGDAGDATTPTDTGAACSPGAAQDDAGVCR